MSSPIFPNTEQILSIIFQEIPNGVYAEDRADNTDVTLRSNSSSELRAHAQVFADLYQNLLDIDSDKFLSTVTPDGLSPWEADLFSSVQDSSQSYATRQQNLLAKYRYQGGISLPIIRTLIANLLTPLGLVFQILPYCGQFNGVINGAWILDESSLGLSTWLAALDPLIGTGLGVGEIPLDCSLDYAAAGITESELVDIQATAYTYEVQIFGNASAPTLSLLDQLLTAYEPARSTHIISNNVPVPT